MIKNARGTAVAGSFYPADKQSLSLMIESFFSKTKKIIKDKKTKALIVPHAGFIYSGQTAAWGYRQLIKDLKNQHFVLIGPSHNFSFVGAAANSFSHWQTPLGQVGHKSAIAPPDQIIIDNKFHQIEHSIEVQLPFLQRRFSNFSISCFLTGYRLDFEKLANYFLKYYSDSIFIFSSDLSHYLPLTQARMIDQQTIKAITNLDEKYFFNNDNVACGAVGITLLLMMAKIAHWQGKLIFYDTSSTASRDERGVVGYAAAAFYQ